MPTDTAQTVAEDADYSARAQLTLAGLPHVAEAGASLVSAGAGSCELRMPLRVVHGQALPSIHEGQISLLATAAGLAAATTLQPESRGATTVEFKVNVIALGQGDALVARARVVRSGRTLTVCRAELTVVKDGAESSCALCLMTLMVSPR